MARLLTAYLTRSDVPMRAALQQAIDRLPFALTLDESYVPLRSSGYLPCTLDGEDTGFDLRFADISEMREDARDAMMTFKWTGDPREEAAALAVCAALAKDFGAVVQRDGAPLSSDDMLAQAKGALV
ncbi:hypothetical protein HL667_28650 [Bradyrhizobium sp. 83012]|uniref:DUF3168 domain-containing protein n=1 Tax=Bradyrhizobium aeschynomenes TaxID=2734909 RepID=A0ABX2CLB2_9BRAD|nr:hypothetical protein [Bradyrhizobium aeschynomenes]NPU69003.1 hypothetical protein [Bradyrhizobium aeschynomenes]